MKKLLSLLFALTLTLQVAFGAIAYDNSADTDAVANCCGNYSVSYTVGSGSNRILFFASISDVPSGGSTAVTYNGVALTRLGQYTSASNYSYLDVWYLINPATGANTLAVTRNGYGRGVIMSYTGVAQTGFPDSSNFNSNTSASNAVSTTVVASNSWLIGFSQAVFNSNGNTASTNRTQRQTTVRIQPATPYLSVAGGDSNGTVTTGSQSFTFSNDTGANQNANGGLTLSIAPYVEPSVSTAKKTTGFFKVARFR